MKEADFTFLYFPESVEYPDVAGTNILPHGTLYEYVPSSFLSGWVNHVELVKAFLITRYRPHAVNVAAAKSFNEGEHFHTEFGKLVSDDLLVLGRAKNGDWWFFWSDRDCSDCEIGRFQTVHDRATVEKLFAEYAQERSISLSKSYAGASVDFELKPAQGLKICDMEENVEGAPALELNVDKAGGWISF